MSDPELETLQQQRIAQFKNNNVDNKQMIEEKMQQMEKKNVILNRVLDQSARARLNTLCLGKPEKGRIVEEMILNMAHNGQLSRKLEEKELINLLENMNQQMQKKMTTVKFDRRRAALDFDDDDADL